MSNRHASAVFDSRAEAERAIDGLREAGVPDSAISIVGRRDDGGTTETDGAGDDLNKSGAVKGAIGGAAAGTVLGIAALAIPGVGPLVAAGAIAASAIPGAAGIGAAVGAAAGGLTGLFSKHDVSDEDSSYYEKRVNDGGYFVSVDSENARLPYDTVRDLLYRNGGHSATQPRTATV